MSKSLNPWRPVNKCAAQLQTQTSAPVPAEVINQVGFFKLHIRQVRKPKKTINHSVDA